MNCATFSGTSWPLPAKITYSRHQGSAWAATEATQGLQRCQKGQHKACMGCHSVTAELNLCIPQRELAKKDPRHVRHVVLYKENNFLYLFKKRHVAHVASSLCLLKFTVFLWKTQENHIFSSPRVCMGCHKSSTRLAGLPKEATQGLHGLPQCHSRAKFVYSPTKAGKDLSPARFLDGMMRRRKQKHVQS